MTNPHLIQQLLTPSDASSSKHSLHERITSSSIDDYSIKQETDKSQVMHPVLVSPDGFVDDRYLLYLKEDNNDLFNFFPYLLNLTLLSKTVIHEYSTFFLESILNYHCY